MSLKQSLAVFVLKGHLSPICSLFQQPPHDFEVQLLLALGHLDLESAEIVQESHPSLFVDHPVDIRAVLH